MANVVNGALPSIASVAVIALVGFLYNRAKSWHGEHGQLVSHLDESEELKAQVEGLRALQEAQNAGIRELMGDKLDHEHARLVAQGHASPQEKAAFEKKYNVYHALGGNGTRTALYEDVMKMNSYPIPDKEEQS